MTDKREQGDIVANVMIHAMMLVSGLDDLEGQTIFRQELKHAVKKLQKELDTIINSVHKGVTEEENKAILACYDVYLSILNGVDSITIEQRNELNLYLPAVIEGISNEVESDKISAPYGMQKGTLDRMSHEKLVERTLKLQKVIEVKNHCISNQIAVLDEYRFEIKDVTEQLEFSRM